MIKVVPNDDVRKTQERPSTEVANLPEPPTAIHSEADGDLTIPRIGLAPNPDVRRVHVSPSGDVASLPVLPAIM